MIIRRRQKRLKEETRLAKRMAYRFPGLSPYGNYDNGVAFRDGYANARHPLPNHKRLARIPCDGTIRQIKKLHIPFVEIVEVTEYKRGCFAPRVVGYVIPRRYLRDLGAATQRRPDQLLRPHPDLILCIREISRAAHRERDAAQAAYQAGRHTLAGNSRRRKEGYYALKDRGIAHAFACGLLRYAGRVPQGLGLYEYADGGMSCFHSTLHPAGVEQATVADHPEVLQVPAKEKVKGVSLKRVVATLKALPEVEMEKFVRSAAPRVLQTAITCWECGEPGHLSSDCPHVDRGDDGASGR